MTAEAVPTGAFDDAEWRVRCDLAACYRLMHRFRMTDLIYTHVSARLPGRPDCFLLNPYGLMFDEITASSLVAVDLDGNPVGPSEGSINPAGFVIHSAILAARADIGCVLHTHTRAGVAVATLAEGLAPLSQHALRFYDRIAYHDYEGIACELDERARLVADLGLHKAMVLRNHGLLTAGESVAEAFLAMVDLEHACQIQIDAMATGRALVTPPPEVCARTARQYETPGEGPALAWRALLHMLDREDPAYRT